MFRSPGRRRLTLTAATLVAVAVATLTAVPAGATPPGIPSKATAQSQLNALTVAAEGSTSGYSPRPVPALDHHLRRLQHPRDGAQARRQRRRGQQLLRRHLGPLVQPVRRRHLDGRGRRRHRPHRAAGRGVAVRRQRVDHQPSGRAFANDLTRPQLIAVTDNVNQSKGDQDPSTWQPSLTAVPLHVRARCGSPPSTTGA